MQETVRPGDVAPAFDLISASGEQVALDSLRGRWVLLFFFPKASTPG